MGSSCSSSLNTKATGPRSNRRQHATDSKASNSTKHVYMVHSASSSVVDVVAKESTDYLINFPQQTALDHNVQLSKPDQDVDQIQKQELSSPETSHVRSKRKENSKSRSWSNDSKEKREGAVGVPETSATAVGEVLSEDEDVPLVGFHPQIYDSSESEDGIWERLDSKQELVDDFLQQQHITENADESLLEELINHKLALLLLYADMSGPFMRLRTERIAKDVIDMYIRLTGETWRYSTDNFETVISNIYGIRDCKDLHYYLGLV